MYKERLPDDSHYRFTTAEIFKNKAFLFYGFTEKSYSKDMHLQEFYEINIILSGEGMHYVGDRRVAVSRGDVFIIPPELRHGYTGSDGFDVYHLVINPAFFEKFSSDLMTLPAFSVMFHAEPAMREKYSSDLHLKLSDQESDELLPLLSDIAGNSYKRDPENTVIGMSRVMILIATLCTKFDAAMKLREKAPDTGDDAFMRSIALIYERYAEKLTVGELCETARMSRSAYLRRFRELTGTSPGEYILVHRLDIAAKMLANTSLSVNAIAEECGFYDAPHLIRTFTKRFNKSPMEYRKGVPGGH